MSGTTCFSVDHYISTATQGTVQNAQQAAFTTLYNYFQQHVAAGNATLHASNYGNGGTGFDFHDGANPSGENAWAVFEFLASASTKRTTDYYVLIQWADTTAFGNSPGNPGQIDRASTDGVGICVAYREGGGSPWGGGTAAAGADAKSTPVWTGTGLRVLKRTNVPSHSGLPAGTDSVAMDDTTRIVDMATLHRLSYIGDADMHMIMYDPNDTGATRFIMFGVYDPLDNLNTVNPYFFFRQNTTPEAATQFGVYNNTSGPAGGITGRDSTKDVVGGGLTWLDNGIQVAQLAPNHQFAPQGASQYDAWPVYLYDWEGNNRGVCGIIDPDFALQVWGPADRDTNAALTRVYFGYGSGNSKWCILWDGVNTPGSTSTRGGHQS